MITIHDLEWIIHRIRAERIKLASNKIREQEITKEDSIHNDGQDIGLEKAEDIVNRLLKSYIDY